jgi:hypothetical protein
VADYIREQFGFKRKKTFMQEVRQMTQKLRRAPNIGQIDPLFEGRAKTYRSVIVTSPPTASSPAATTAPSK